jgi:hypothetical protein
MNNMEHAYEEALKKATKTIEKLDSEVRSLRNTDPAVIIGMACRFPGGADTPESFWRILSEGKDASIDIPKEISSLRISMRSTQASSISLPWKPTPSIRSRESCSK